jgi:hypothetical protein
MVCDPYGVLYWPLSTHMVTAPALLQVRVMPAWFPKLKGTLLAGMVLWPRVVRDAYFDIGALRHGAFTD